MDRPVKDWIKLTEVPLHRGFSVREVTDIDPIRLLSAWLRWATEQQLHPPADVRMDTVAVLAAIATERGSGVRGPQDL